jgi:S-adenosylmethionine:tRNA ribosyltransferase-isomerase
LVLDGYGRLRHDSRSRLLDHLRAGDLVVANDAATLPASLHGRLESSYAAVELRLAGMASLRPEDFGRFVAVLFGSGDYHQPTEERSLPPSVAPGERLLLGPLVARIEAVLGHPRLLQLRFEGDAASIWSGLARQGRPIQYAYMKPPLALWDVWAPVAGRPAAFEPPSAGFALDWCMLAAMRGRGIGFATLTHAAGISSTGDASLDARLPLPEPYHIPVATVEAVRQTQAAGGRVVAVGTTVVRALEHAAAQAGGLRAGDGLADQKLGPGYRLNVVDMLLSGTHEAETSHYQLLRAFTDDASLQLADEALEQGGYLTHEFGDSVLIERKLPAGACDAASVEKIAA